MLFQTAIKAIYDFFLWIICNRTDFGEL